MPTLHEIALDQEDPPEYYGATLYFRGCKIFTEPFQRLSRPTPGSLVDAVEAELAKHARLHRAARSAPCAVTGDLNDIFRLPVSDSKKRLHWLTSGTITTTWNDDAGTYHMEMKRGRA